ncbi:tetratricopeptide repeat protein 28-like [Acropora muricata]|uniref:tetratricopeptide repeat protein 28-like n=1 Tax=Acropora muricata TaxID=159855 RepID=UPI0034E58801
MENHEECLKLAIEIGDRAREGRAYGNLGNTYRSLGDFRKAIEYHEKDLKIAKEIGGRAGKGGAYGNLEIGDRAEEGRAYGNLGNAYRLLNDFRISIKYHEEELKIFIEIDDRAGERRAYGSLGLAYDSLGDFLKAIEYHAKLLKISKEIGDRAGEGRAYGSLGKAYRSLGDFRKGIEYHKRDLKIAKEIGGRADEGRAYGNLEIGDQAGEGRAYGNLGNAYLSLGDLQAIVYYEKDLRIALEIGDRDGEGRAYGNLGNAFFLLGDFRKGIECDEKLLKIAREIGSREKEGTAYHNIGSGYSGLRQFDIAVGKFVSAVDVWNTLRCLLKSEGNWKMKFREQYEMTYTSLWRSLLRTGKIKEALFAADQGRAQTLYDDLLIQYGLASPLSCVTFDSKESTIHLFTEHSSQIIFLGLEGLMVNIWFLNRGQKVAFRRGMLDADLTEKDPIRALLQAASRKIGAEVEVRCKDRTLGECLSRGEVCEEVEKSCQCSDNPFRPIYDAVIAPIADLLGSKCDELVIASDDALCFTPWAAIVESIRIRTVPSLTSYQLISSVPKGYHKKTGALLVGNPCLKELENPLPDLPCAQEEVEMIASILNTRPLTGREATKAEVIKRMSSVGLIHIAAHGNKRTGKIALSPNPGWISKLPQEKDFFLKMSDVQAANLRACLVVLSCCHSGRGRILKDDEATMVFMKNFYQHLKEGKSASAAIHQSMTSLRESENFSEMRYWAPFLFIGDDVKIEIEADDDVKSERNNGC